jgi:hypothetical protein
MRRYFGSHTPATMPGTNALVENPWDAIISEAGIFLHFVSI